MELDYKRLAINGGAILANNAGGYIWSIKNSQGNSAVDQAFSNLLSSLNLGSNAKYVKTAAYDLAALAALELTENQSESVKLIGDYAAEVAKGLGTSTLAADPTYITAGMGRASRQVTTNVPPSPPPRITNAII